MLKLTHVGETLIAEMFNASPAVRAALEECAGRELGGFEAITEAPLASYGALAFDGASRIDVALVDAARRRCVACEAKLGVTLMAKDSFEDRFLGGCSTSHEGTRVRGSMPAILERKLPATAARTALKARIDGVLHVVEPAWILIVRRAVAARWAARGRPALSRRCAVAVFEDLVDAYGGQAPFNELVRGHLRFDYFAEWLSSRRKTT
jgi:hypothetical protein